MENFILSDLIKVVQQPEHSKQKLIAYQEKYGISTMEFIMLHKEGIPLPIPDKDVRDWHFQLTMYVITEGDIMDLKNAESFDTPLALIA